MLLAAQTGKTVEVLFVDKGQPGDRVTAAGGPAGDAAAAAAAPAAEIDIDTFFTMPIASRTRA